MPTVTGKATDLITFSRGSLATVTDSDGLIKWAPHNLLTHSEQFDNAAWIKSNGSITTANAATAPDVTTTADEFTSTAAFGTVQQTYSSLIVGGSYTFKAWLKKGTTTSNWSLYDASNAVVLDTMVSGSDWQLLSGSFTASATSIVLRITDRDNANTGTIYIWGAHLYRSDLGGMQANASAYPYYNPSTPKNLLGYTELLTTGWTNTNTTDSQVAVAAPNGSANSIEVTATAGNGTLLASLSLLASPYTFSIWLKRKTGTGTVEITVDGTTYVTAAVTSDWQRFSTTLTPSAGTKTPGIRLVTSGDAVYAWGAQLSDSASLDPYSPVFGAAPSAAAAHGPRLDHDPVTLAAKGLLVEEQRTNLLQRSAEFDQSPWTNVDLTSVSANAGVAPDGTTTADAITFSSVPVNRIQQTAGAAVNGETLTFSVWLKGSGTISVTVGTSTGVGGQTEITASLSSTWTRFSTTVTLSSPTGDRRVIIVWRSGNNNTSAIQVWGAQLEAGSFATSYIPTAASTVTRNADVASVGVSQFPYSATEGTIVVSGDFVGFDAAKQPTFASITDGTPNSTPSASWVNISQDTSNVVSSRRSASTTATDITASNTQTPNVVRKVGLAFKQGGTDALSVNGGTVATQSGVAAAYTNNILKIGAFDTASSPSVTDPFYLNGHVRQITYIPRQLSSAELEARTA